MATEKHLDELGPMSVHVIPRVNGVGSVLATWLCVKCGRPFKLPKVPGSCEQLFSVCMTCFAISCTDLPNEESVDNG